MSRRPELLLVAALAGIALFASLASLNHINETTDEVPHIAAAYSHVLKGDFRLTTEHPPLSRELAGLPLLLLKPRFDASDPSWNYSRAWEVGRKFLYHWNTPERIVYWARVPIVALYLALALLLWRVARRLYGEASGMVAFALALFTPDLLAHGQLVTTDLAVSLFFFAAVWWFYRGLVEEGWGHSLLMGGACGCALMSKHSAILLLPVLGLLGFFYVLFAERFVDLPEPPPLKARFLKVGRLVGIALLVSVAIVWAVFGFRYAISPDLEILVPWEEFDPHSLLTRTVLALREWRLLPEAYLAGILESSRQLGKRYSFLLGVPHSGGRWNYFPVTFLFKTPLPLLLMLVATLPRKKPRLSFLACCLLFPPLLYLLVAMTSELNIGNRHILPIYPFLIAWAAQCGRVFTPEGGQGLSASRSVSAGRWQRPVLVLLLVWLVAGTLRVYPNFLSYFNELAGGPEGGGRYLSDSNLDWGQNLNGLAVYQREHPGEELYVCYFGSAEAGYYLPGARILPCMLSHGGPFVTPPRGATVAISHTALSGILLRDLPEVREFVDRLKSATPIDRVGYSILIYRMP